MTPAERTQRMIRGIARRHGCSFGEIMGRRRSANIISARFEAYDVLRHRGHSLPEIGRIMGGRDHTTILYGLRQLPIKRAKEAARAAAVDGGDKSFKCGETFDERQRVLIESGRFQGEAT